MIHRINDYTKDTVNPETGLPYDDSWVVFLLTDEDYPMHVGGEKDRAYVLRIGKKHSNWRFALGDFIDYYGSADHKALVALSQETLDDALKAYEGHSCRDNYLRDYESPVLIHSTTKNSYESIRKDKCLKSWNRLKKEGFFTNEEPIGMLLGDPLELRDFILFGSGVTGEIVVNSKEKRRIEMDCDQEYQPGARLYFDMKRIAEDGLLIRDGSEMKVKDVLPLDPYLIWVATIEELDLEPGAITPKQFADKSDSFFREHFLA